MRVAHEFLRAQLEGQHAQRMKKMPEWPILFAGERDELRFAAALPARVQAAASGTTGCTSRTSTASAASCSTA
jgi:hypothetical protein